VKIELHAVIVSVLSGEPVFCVETDAQSGLPRLPVAQFRPDRHRSLEQPLIDVYLEDFEGRTSNPELLDCRLSDETSGAHAKCIEITYLILVRPMPVKRGAASGETDAAGGGKLRWQSVYMTLPWEDWRHGRPSLLDAVVLPLFAPSGDGTSRSGGVRKRGRTRRDFKLSADAALFADTDTDWDPRRTRDRYEALAARGAIAELVEGGQADSRLGTVMVAGERRRLSLALGHLRRAIKDRPDVGGVMPSEFTLFELQKCVEAILGPALHKQNFRRQLDASRLLEPVGRVKGDTGGRPAQLYRFAR